MITIRRSEERGRSQLDWLDTRFTFSFADYFDPRWVQFGDLRVLNQDLIAPSGGFGMHGHRDMEIVTWVLDGSLRHRDSMGNGSLVVPGDVQFMSAGKGVMHSEFNASETAPLHLLQMWVLPRASGTEPRYGQRHFDARDRTNRPCLVVSPDGAEDSIAIGQDARMHVTTLESEHSVEFDLGHGRRAWLHVARGRVQLGDLTLEAGDGAGVQGQSKLQVRGLAGAADTAELVLWDLR